MEPMMTSNLTPPHPPHTIDWCHVEGLGVGAYDFNAFSPANATALAKMFECSPVAHIDKVVMVELVMVVVVRGGGGGNGGS